MSTRCEVTIVNSRGLHARASAKFVNAVNDLPEGVSVSVSKDGNHAEGSSILGLMMLGAARGNTIEITVEGGEQDAVLEQLAALVRDGFGED